MQRPLLPVFQPLLPSSSPPPLPPTMLFVLSSVLFSCVFVHLRWHSRQLNVSTKTEYFTSHLAPSLSPYACLSHVTHSVFPNLLSSLELVGWGRRNMCSWFAFKFPFFSLFFRLLPFIYFSQSIGWALSYDVISLTHTLPPSLSLSCTSELCSSVQVSKCYLTAFSRTLSHCPL